MFQIESIKESLKESLLSQLQNVRVEHPRACQRTLDVADIDMIVQKLASVKPEADDLKLVALLYGGYVPNSYRGVPESDIARVEIDLVSGETKVSLVRGRTQRRPCGRGNTTIIRLLKDRQSTGRLVA